MYIVRQDVCFYENTRSIRKLYVYDQYVWSMQVYAIECTVLFLSSSLKPKIHTRVVTY